MSNWSSPHEAAACFCKSAMTLGSGIFFDRDVRQGTPPTSREDSHVLLRSSEGNGQASHDHTIHRNGGRGTKGTPGLAAHSLGEVNFGCWKVGKCFGTSMCSADTMEHWSKKSSIDHLVRDTSPVRASGASCSSVSLSQNLLAVM